MLELNSMLPEELAERLRADGLPRFRADQVFRWLTRGVRSFDEMTNLPLPLRDSLAARYRLSGMAAEQINRATDGTAKILWRLDDSETIESVVMPYRHGNTVCISTQVGCAMGCHFCASTMGGLVRNLTAGEMLAQVIQSGLILECDIANIVLMGIGEPLHNYDNVLRFLRLVSHPDGRNLGMRHISLSTCAPPGGIRRLMEERLQLTLSISLHAPDDETRAAIMPVGTSVPVREIIRDANDYFKHTGRRVSFEYILLDGVNDSPRQAERLAVLCGGAHINLIPMNAVPGSRYQPSPPETVRRFQQILAAHGANATLRRRMGNDIDAACGQLRRKNTSANGDIA